MLGGRWILSLWEDQSLSGLFIFHRRGTSARVDAALSLATRLYQIDHGGQLPATTAALIPAYFPPVPKGVSVPNVFMPTPPTKAGKAGTAAPPPTSGPATTRLASTWSTTKSGSG